MKPRVWALVAGAVLSGAALTASAPPQAGDVVSDAVLGSMEFACKVVGSKLVLVLGHTPRHSVAPTKPPDRMS